jgi:LysM repeat protein
MAKNKFRQAEHFQGQVHMHRLVGTLQVSIKVLALLVLGMNSSLQAQTLLGSRQSMERQNMLAVSYGYSFLENGQAVNRFVQSGHLVKIQRTGLMDLANVSYPYARPAVKTFLDRLSTQYNSACGEKMTVTSLTRPMNKQPANASQNSVHPTGMAVDLRIPQVSKCRAWLETTLLSLEKADVLDVTRERNPPHYHVALFTQPYEAYVAGGAGQKASSANTAQAITAAAPAAAAAPISASAAPITASIQNYTVRKGDSLDRIAKRTGVSVRQIRVANGIRGDMIKPGQVLQIPGSAQTASGNQQVATVSEVSHRVRRGETLWRIASLYGTSVNSIRQVNGLADDLLQVGQVLRVTLLSSARH